MASIMDTIMSPISADSVEDLAAELLTMDHRFRLNQADSVIVDANCGHGNLVLHLAMMDACQSIMAFDKSPGNIKTAKSYQFKAKNDPDMKALMTTPVDFHVADINIHNLSLLHSCTHLITRIESIHQMEFYSTLFETLPSLRVMVLLASNSDELKMNELINESMDVLTFLKTSVELVDGSFLGTWIVPRLPCSQPTKTAKPQITVMKTVSTPIKLRARAQSDASSNTEMSKEDLEERISKELPEHHKKVYPTSPLGRSHKTAGRARSNQLMLRHRTSREAAGTLVDA